MNYKAQNIQSVNNLLAGICTQSLYIQSSIPEKLNLSFESCQETKDHPPAELIHSLFLSEMGRYREVFIITDALDECSERNSDLNKFLASLRDLESLTTRVQLLFTSRPSVTILAYFPDCKTLPISAQPEDIERYARSKVSCLHDPVRHDKNLQEDIVSVICKTSGGM
jgi:hypothetical protein